MTESSCFGHSRRAGSELNVSDVFGLYFGLLDDLVTLGIPCRFEFFPINDARPAFRIVKVDDFLQV